MFLAIVISAAAGYLAGILTPGFIARIRGEAKKGVTFAETEVKAVEGDVKAKEDQIKKIL